jgi:DNA-binding transcriptional LysR family regulator
VLLDLCCDFYALNPPTRLRLRTEILSGTLDALTSGQADLALGVTLEPASAANLRARPLGSVRFVYAMAPTHPLAQQPEPLSDAQLLAHRAVVVADSTPGAATLSFGLLAGQQTLTVSSLQAKLEAHLRGLGVGFCPSRWRAPGWPMASWWRGAWSAARAPPRCTTPGRPTCSRARPCPGGWIGWSAPSPGAPCCKRPRACRVSA